MFALEYGGVEWFYTIPRPFAALILAQLSTKDEVARESAVYSYIDHVLLPESVGLLWDRALDVGDSFDLEDVAGLIEEIQGAYSSRPFHVDVALAATAVANWPMVRGRFVMNGIADPLRDLPNVYALLDAVELMILEGQEDEKARDRYWVKMYSPPPGSIASKRVPRGWSREDELAGFEDWE